MEQLCALLSEPAHLPEVTVALAGGVRTRCSGSMWRIWWSLGAESSSIYRTISAPIHALRGQSQEVESGTRPAPEPLRHFGVGELAELWQSLLSMAASLSERSEAIGTYTQHVTHELKSPVTTIIGAAELLEIAGARLEPEQRARLLAQIHSEGLWMDAMARVGAGAESCDLEAGVSRCCKMSRRLS